MHRHPLALPAAARATAIAARLLCASLATCAAFALVPQAAMAQTAAAEAARSYAIPAGPLGAALTVVSPRRPGAELRDDGWCCAEQDEAGAEWEGADHVGWHDRYPTDGALRGTGAVIANRG